MLTGLLSLMLTRDAAAWTSPEQMVAALDALAVSAPDLVSRVDLGSSVEGRAIVGVRISATTTPEAQWRLLGAHHGDEPPSAEIALETAITLVERYGADEAVTALLDRDAVWVVPQVNPDGIVALTRHNAADVDLNRNYDYEWTAREFHPGDAAFSEPETRAIRALHAWQPFAAGLSLHAGASNIGWVWNYTTAPSQDASLVQQMAEDYADSTDDPDFWATNGADWYLTWGDTTDWAYGRHGTLDFTLEVSAQKQPDAATMEALATVHRESILGFLRWPDRLSGVVVDAETGRGLPAEITLVEGGAPLWSGPDGRFARLVEAGAWTVQVAVPGYETLIFEAEEAEDLGELALTPYMRVELRPQPVLLRRDEGGLFSLPVAASRVWLRRGGEAPVAATRLGLAWYVDLDALAPGPWDLDIDGDIAPRALFVDEIDEARGLSGVSLTGNELLISGWNLGFGSRVLALWGGDRAPVELPVLDEQDDHLVLDAAALADAPALVDLVVLSGGYQMAWPDVRGLAPAPDAPDVAAGCSADPASTRLWPTFLGLLALIARGRASGASSWVRGRTRPRCRSARHRWARRRARCTARPRRRCSGWS